MSVNADATNTSSNGSSSGNGTSNTNPSQQQTAYKAMIQLDGQSLHAQSEVLKLLPGMQVVAEVNEGKRSVMRYLLSPVEKTLDESGTER